MNLAAAMVAFSLFGIQQDVLTSANGKPAEYVIRLTEADVETIREGRRTLESNIARTNQGGKLYRIYMDEQPNQRAVEDQNIQNIDVRIKPSRVATENVYSISLSESQLQQLAQGVVFGGALPTNGRTVGVKFEVMPNPLATGVAPPEDERFPERDAIGGSRPNEIRNRDYLERSRLASRERDQGAYVEPEEEPAYVEGARRRANEARLTLATPRPSRMYDDFLRHVAAARNSRGSLDQSAQMVSSNLNSPNVGFQGGYSEPFSGAPPRTPRDSGNFKVNPGAGINRNGEQAPAEFDDRRPLPRNNSLDTQKVATTSDSRLPVVVLFALLSLGANLFLGRQVFVWYMRYRDVIDQVRMGNNWSNESRTSTI
jgi:hypothetical protein